ncbi:unnamed protein product [Linum trigynum]|uniref:Uncharacterized protein n=1 Tax=Linum trigynum TaxID=586398 RepID=A0AAV2C953_9ROSI
MVEMLDAGNKIAERSTKELIGAIERGNSIQEHQRERIYHANEIYAELERLDLPETLLDQAYKFFVGNRQQTSMMFGLPEGARLRFVMSLSNKPSFWMNDD